MRPGCQLDHHGHDIHVVFFKRILNFNPQSADQREKRHHNRYDLPSGSPIQCSITHGTQNLSCSINNLSSNGASLVVKPDVSLRKGDTIKVTLKLESQSLTTAANIVHTRTTNSDLTVGLVFEFADFEARKAYLQLLEPVSIGVSLSNRPVPSRDTEPGYDTICFHGINKTLLTVWRDQEHMAITGFEFRMNDYYVRNGKEPHKLAIYVSAPESSSLYDGVELKRTDLETAEVRQLYRWTVAHLNPALPTEVRELMQHYT
uniref:PilZ domain-containing protein n=1 Tax=Cephaloticoccus sp. TaxID=1985742 RepID=UPI00404A9D00